jgi:hypothetical protein
MSKGVTQTIGDREKDCLPNHNQCHDLLCSQIVHDNCPKGKSLICLSSK